MVKTFVLRIDLESDKGIREGLPKILKILKKHEIKASFYLTMGGESNIFELLRYQKKLPGKREVKVFSKLEILRMSLFPKNFVKKNKKILRKILEEDHELGIHGWKHRAWTRGLEKINIEKHLDKSIKMYKKIFKKSPESFCSPAFRINKKVIWFLNKKDFKIISDLDGEEPKKIPDTKITNVPITIKGKESTPIIESLISLGYPDNKILSHLKKEIKSKKYSSMYIHSLYEGIQKIKLLDELFSWIKKNKIKTKTLQEIAKK